MYDKKYFDPNTIGDWAHVEDILPIGVWSEHYKDGGTRYSEDVLFCNDLTVFVGFFDRDLGYWCTGCPADPEWVDDVSWWKPLPLIPRFKNGK